MADMVAADMVAAVVTGMEEAAAGTVAAVVVTGMEAAAVGMAVVGMVAAGMAVDGVAHHYTLAIQATTTHLITAIGLQAFMTVMATGIRRIGYVDINKDEPLTF